LQLIGRSRDPRATPPLVAALTGVRTRADVVQALEALGDRAAAPVLGRLLGEDPYVNVRAAAARALGALGGDKAHAALVAALARERELPVRSAITAALAKPAKSSQPAPR
jgi:HEAT repeat protein